MLSCADVRPLLAEIETGEHASGDVHDHLASCAACRAAAGEVRAEIETMRRDLAGLGASPFLEDAVLAVAAETEPESVRARGPGRRTAIAVALGAAALLLVVLLAGRWRGTGAEIGSQSEHDAAGEGEVVPGWGPALVRLPLSALELENERAQNPFAGLANASARPGLFVTRQRGVTSVEAVVAALPTTQPHRWVVPASDTGLRDQVFTVRGLVPEGMCVLGGALLKERPPLTTRPPRWPDRVEVILEDPSGEGAGAHLVAVFDRSYTGDLLVPAALGRAVGLHGFEMPGTCVIQGDQTIRAHRALARVRIPDWNIDGMREVQVRAPVLERGLPPQPAPDGSVGWGLHLDGDLPQGGYANSRFVYDLEATKIRVEGERFQVDPNSQRRPFFSLLAPLRGLALAYDADEFPECTLVLPTIDSGAGNQLLMLERVTLQQRFEPGWEVAVARVWDDRTMIPSGESVALTTVGPDGRVSFVRTRGEEGPLRLRLSKAGAASRVVTVYLDVPARPTLRISIDAQGMALVGTTLHSLFVPGSSPGQRSLDADALQRLGAAIQEESRKTGWSGEAGSVSPLVLQIVGSADTPFLAALGCLQAGATAGVADCTFILRGEGGQGFSYRLPTDRGLVPRNPAAKKAGPLKIRLLRRDGAAWATLREPDGTEAFEGALRAGTPFWAELAGALSAQRRALKPKRRLVAKVSLIPATAAEVRFDEVRRLLDALRSGGVDDILFESPAYRVR